MAISKFFVLSKSLVIVMEGEIFATMSIKKEKGEYLTLQNIKLQGRFAIYGAYPYWPQIQEDLLEFFEKSSIYDEVFYHLEKGEKCPFDRALLKGIGSHKWAHIYDRYSPIGDDD